MKSHLNQNYKLARECEVNTSNYFWKKLWNKYSWHIRKTFSCLLHFLLTALSDWLSMRQYQNPYLCCQQSRYCPKCLSTEIYGFQPSHKGKCYRWIDCQPRLYAYRRAAGFCMYNIWLTIVNSTGRTNRITPVIITCTVKPVLSRHSKIDKMKVLKTGGSLTQV